MDWLVSGGGLPGREDACGQDTASRLPLRTCSLRTPNRTPPTNTQIMLPVLLRSKESSHTYICRTQVTFFLGEGLCLCFPRI